MITCFLLIPPATGIGQELNDIKKEGIEQLFSPYLRTDMPGCAVLISWDGKILLKKGYGMADLEHGIPNTATTVFYAGSVSKQFVASCILLLAEEGRIDMDAGIHDYLSDFPSYGGGITIRHLVHHTSGIKDYFDIFEAQKINYLNEITVEEVYELIKSEPRLHFDPGSRHKYSNSGYLILGMLIKEASGLSLAEYARSRFFDPLGMFSTDFLDDNGKLVYNRACGYRLNLNDEVENMIMRFDLVGSGGLYTTVEDLYRWDQNLLDHRIGTDQFFTTLVEPGTLNDGSKTDYAFALRVGSFQGHQVIGHSGSLGGYRAHYMQFPRLKLSIIILGNRADLKPAELANEIASILLAD